MFKLDCYTHDSFCDQSHFNLFLKLHFLVSFYWSDESDVDYANWNEDEPSDSLLSQAEECVEMFTNGTWNDVSCDQTKCFVCKESGT